MLLREEVVQLQEEVHLLRQMKDMLSKDLEETQGGCSANLLSATELRVQLGDKEQELDRAKEALQGEDLPSEQAAVLFWNMDKDKRVEDTSISACGYQFSVRPNWENNW